MNASSKVIQEEAKDADKSKLIESNSPETAKKEAPKKPPRSKEQKSESFNFILGYAKRECGSILLGIVFLIGGSLSDLAVPLFIGRVVDLLQKGEFDEIGTLCLYMLIVIFVSPHSETDLNTQIYCLLWLQLFNHATRFCRFLEFVLECALPSSTFLVSA